ncbi:uncharacterized protein LOC128579823 [Nycticebus coucang]|uniref:uncharacterized protein LOC128579823 n=1 Tax=Nycticebus coucang TaxID=9470 RepID=UPI00234D840C|nr:uncharacterized protein LOC128579823 [Nycticebus coucang]
MPPNFPPDVVGQGLVSPWTNDFFSKVLLVVKEKACWTECFPHILPPSAIVSWIKKILEGRRFDDIQDIEHNTAIALTAIPKKSSKSALKGGLGAGISAHLLRWNASKVMIETEHAFALTLMSAPDNELTTYFRVSGSPFLPMISWTPFQVMTTQMRSIYYSWCHCFYHQLHQNNDTIFLVLGDSSLPCVAVDTTSR